MKYVLIVEITVKKGNIFEVKFWNCSLELFGIVEFTEQTRLNFRIELREIPENYQT